MAAEISETTQDGCGVVWAGGVAVVTITNPRRRNCLSSAVIEDLQDVFRHLALDSTCRAVVLTGAEGYFCAGADTKAMASLDSAGALDRLAAGHAIVQAIARLPVPVVAAVEGGAAGGGLTLVAACDLVVVASDARLVLAFERLGLAPDLGALYFFERRMGLSATRRLAFLASEIDAKEAVQLGLMDELVPPGTARARALEMASLIAQRSRAANSVVKDMLAEPPPSLTAALADESRHAAQLYESAEYVKATRAGR